MTNTEKAFDLPVKVSIDYGKGKDFTASIVGFLNAKGQFIVLANFDDTTKIGKMMINELENKRLEQLKGSQYHNIAIDEVVPYDKALECVKQIKEDYRGGEWIDKPLEIIKQALETKSKKELAWEIVKGKGVDVATFNTYQTVIEYNWSIRFEKYKRKELTQQEFDLLKEMLE